jgi:hypothetical protein
VTLDDVGVVNGQRVREDELEELTGPLHRVFSLEKIGNTSNQFLNKKIDKMYDWVHDVGIKFFGPITLQRFNF